MRHSSSRVEAGLRGPSASACEGFVLDFTDPSAAFTVAWSDPPPKPIPPGTIFCCDVTGAWSTYWYNRELCESNIGEGLNIWKPLFQQQGAINLKRLNPQTQEFSLD
jgi:hypothetical protein